LAPVLQGRDFRCSRPKMAIGRHYPGRSVRRSSCGKGAQAKAFDDAPGAIEVLWTRAVEILVASLHAEALHQDAGRPGPDRWIMRLHFKALGQACATRSSWPQCGGPHRAAGGPPLVGPMRRRHHAVGRCAVGGQRMILTRRSGPHSPWGPPTTTCGRVDQKRVEPRSGWIFKIGRGRGRRRAPEVGRRCAAAGGPHHLMPSITAVVLRWRSAGWSIATVDRSRFTR